VRFALRDSESFQRRSILTHGWLQLAARVEHHDRDRFELAIAGILNGCRYDALCHIQIQHRHVGVRFILVAGAHAMELPVRRPHRG
jgi:hypothetical protein